MSFRIQVEGEQALKAALRRKQSGYAHAFTAGFYAMGSEIMRKSIRLVPKDFGFLAGSHFVTRPRLSKATRVGYGVKYAVHVHEREDVKHLNGTSAKYLSKPFDEAKATFRPTLARWTKKFFKAGVRIGQVKSEYPTKPKGDPTKEQLSAARAKRSKEASKVKRRRRR